MRPVRVLLPFLLLLSAACAPVTPVAPVPESAVPSGPLLRALDERRQSFTSLRAIASARVVRKTRRMALDSVGILLRADGKFRIEAYSPLGQPLVQVIWNGETTAIFRNGEPMPVPGQAALERYLGADVAPADLCGLLTGNLPSPDAAEEASARCGGGRCVVELRSGDRMRRFRFAAAEHGSGGIRPESYELFRADHLVLRTRYSESSSWSGYLLPGTVAIENPDRRSGITLTYEEPEVNVLIDDAVFSLEGPAR